MTSSDHEILRRDIALVPVTAANLDEVDAVFDAMRAFSERVEGISKKTDAANAFAKSRPPNHDPRKKHAFLARAGERTIGLLDLIEDFPAPGTVYIGLLAIDERFHGLGLGHALWHAAERFACERLNAERLRLAVVESNPVTGFWQKMGFRPTGEIKPYQGERISSRAILMEKSIAVPED